MWTLHTAVQSMRGTEEQTLSPLTLCEAVLLQRVTGLRAHAICVENT